MMLRFILFVFIGLTNLPKTIPCVVSYGQCGGLEYTGSTDCCTPSTCVYSNPWYSQCIPSSVPSTTGCSALYEQCGGENWSGPTCCDYSTCIYSNPWYSQCLTISASSSSSAGPFTAPSTSSTNPSTTPSTSSSSSSSSSTISSSTVTESAQSSSTSSTNQNCNGLYAQCGGIGWNGGTTCCSGSTCTFIHAYYSQCLSSSSSSSGGGVGSDSSTTISSENENRQSGVTTRYWDCCKASCGWSGKALVTNPVKTCAQDGITAVDVNTQSGCVGGSGYMCNNQQPWNVSSTLSYGFAAAHIGGETESDWCCECYSLIFTSGTVVGKEMIVQVTNTGGDLGNNHFDLQMPGGGMGIFDGCTSQFGSSYSWGARYGGVSQRSDCDSLPAVIRSGCYWRFDWFLNADNPSISFKQVECPSVLTDITQCSRI